MAFDSYRDLVDSWGYTVVEWHEEGSYQGDTWVLLQDANSGLYGYLCFGWGSCAGCDALEACHGFGGEDAFTDLAKRMHEAIFWGNMREMRDFFLLHDWIGDYGVSWSFVLAVLKRLDAGIFEGIESFRNFNDFPDFLWSWRTQDYRCAVYVWRDTIHVTMVTAEKELSVPLGHALAKKVATLEEVVSVLHGYEKSNYRVHGCVKAWKDYDNV